MPNPWDCLLVGSVGARKGGSEMEPYPEIKLVRAWIMVRANDDASNAARAIYHLNVGLVWPHRHIVRADVVEGIEGIGGDFNIMVPVWAESPDAIRVICELIGEAVQAEVIGVAMVQGGVEGHYPEIPHKAWGWTTSAEANPTARPLGFNGWG
jgi:hypothetical protein